jgi:hypothetical protein
MASTPARNWQQALAGGVTGMIKSRTAEEEAVRQEQLKMLGVSLDLDKQVREHQDRILQLNQQAENQTATHTYNIAKDNMTKQLAGRQVLRSQPAGGPLAPGMEERIPDQERPGFEYVVSPWRRVTQDMVDKGLTLRPVNSILTPTESVEIDRSLAQSNKPEKPTPERQKWSANAAVIMKREGIKPLKGVDAFDQLTQMTDRPELAQEAQASQTPAQQTQDLRAEGILSSLKIARDPTMTPTQQLRKVHPELLGQLTEAPARPEEPLITDLSPITNTTTTGIQYVDGTGLMGKMRDQAQHLAMKQGIPYLDKDSAFTVAQIEEARRNQDALSQQLLSKLPKDPMGRITGGLGNKLSALTQSDPVLAALGTYFGPAIQQLRALAGSKNLRMNKSEIDRVFESDIPKMTDTYGAALQKLNNIRTFLKNAEMSVLPLRVGQVRTAPDGTRIRITKVSPDGRHYDGNPVQEQ